MSVRPVPNETEGHDSDADDEEGFGEGSGVRSERLRLPKEDEFVRKLRDPRLPTQEAVDAHNARGHIPYRDWCPLCVQAKGKCQYHNKDKGAQRVLPEYAWDYCFPGDELGFKLTVLVGTSKGADCAMATAVLAKG